ncbi:hypothetical protein NUW58_g7768 [Xylaria curta]|uniref:Uncharacterized protein n=1 Tax=Xylaria curta TaxID=42375 RepID=A0ACC1NF24_9PEZI|nr:hypothetical protein NUW58_g7768 [Xylaria curta]
MEALAALGLASNIVQFLDFTWRLTSAAGEIRNSASGATERTIELDKIYGKLSGFCSNLAKPSEAVEDNEEAQRVQKLFSNSANDLQRHIIIQSHNRDLQALASDCIPLCQQLLAATNKLQARGGSSHKFKSFKTALRTLWDEKKIDDLEERLKRYQHTISLHFLPLIEQHTSYTTSLLQRLRHEGALLRIEQAAQFDRITSRLEDIKGNLSTTVPQIVVPHSGEQSSSDKATELLDLGDICTARLLTTDDIDSIVNGISNLSVSGHDILVLAREQAFLRSLDFVSRRYRYDDIPEAYKQTFGWMLDPSKQTGEGKGEQRSLLIHWLRNGNGTFWLSGKAGSGKSTLMKYIANHDETRRSLEVWAGAKKLVIASHYFWNAGAEMQKSQAGLYRSLLYDFLRACPGLIPRLYPSRWASTKISRTPLRSDNWSGEELLTAIQNLIRLPDSSIRYCIFIDGVDEYDGDHFELCRLLKELSCSSNMKCCISSRPWNVFEDALGADSIPRLKLHELTRQDILVYAQSRLAEHPRWNSTYFSQDQMDSVIESITERAQGVFLWVCLVGRSLRKGLFDGDTIRDLQRRLDSLPSDLESFFRHIISQVDNMYHNKMARLLLTAVNARQSLDLEFYRRQEYEEEDSDYALNKSAEEATGHPQELIQESCQRRINARCGGLLEIRKGRVEFLHRSVRDFLLTREMNDYLHLESGPEFKVNLSILRIYIYSFRCWIQNNRVALAEDQALWRDALAYANDALVEDTEAASILLDSIEDFYEHMPVGIDCEFLNVSHDFVFQSEILRAGVDRYVAVKLKENPGFFDSVFESPLCTAMEGSPWSQGNMSIVRQLLENGADPNDQGWETPWVRFLQLTCQQKSDHNFNKALQSSLFSEFLKRGADVGVKVYMERDVNALAGDEDVDSPKLPSTQFLLALFRYKDSYRLGSECIHTLEDFYSSDVGLIKLEVAEALPLLKSQLEQLAMKLPEPGRLRFLAQVILKLISKWKQSGSDLKVLIPSISGLFPVATGAALSDMINNTGGEPQGRPRRLPVKRSQSGAVADTRPKKMFARSKESQQ